MQENNYFRTHVITYFDLQSVWLNMPWTVHYNLHVCWEMGGWGRFLKYDLVLCQKYRGLPNSWWGSAENTASRSKTTQKIK